MQQLFVPVRSTREFLARPAVQILAGLAVLLTAMVSPGFPACTGMALVALGATTITIGRFNQSPARQALLLAHGLIYAALYLLFVGATFDAVSRAGASLSLLATFDLALSLLPMAAAAGRITSVLRHLPSTEP